MLRHLPSLAALLLLTGAADATTLTTATTWSGQIALGESVRVESGATLTILPGSIVTVAAGSKLEVAGQLVVENVHFTGSGWEGIVLKGCDRRTVLRGGRIDGAKTGLFAGGGAPRIEGVTVSGNETGIELKQKSAATIADCRIVENRKVGLFIKDEATPTVTGNTFSGNGKSGVYIYRALPVRFSGNRFEKNEVGLTAANVGSDPLIEGNHFEENNVAVLVERAARPTLRHNLFHNNRTALRLYRRADARIEGNRFEGNDTALSLAFSSYPLIVGNDFLANGLALFLEFESSVWEAEKGEVLRASEAGSRSAFGQGNGHAETAAARRRPEELTGLVEASNNWWGEEGTLELVRIGAAGNPSFIHDGRDAPTFVESGRSWPLDRVNFAPWRSAPNNFRESP